MLQRLPHFPAGLVPMRPARRAVTLLLMPALLAFACAQGPPSQVTDVSSPSQLYAAVDQGSPFIRIVDHFALKPQGTAQDVNFQLFLNKQNLSMAIWGECKTPVNSTIYQQYQLPQNAGTCAISLPGKEAQPEMFVFSQGHSRLWLSNLLIYSNNTEADSRLGSVVTALGGRLWVVRVGMGGAWVRDGPKSPPSFYYPPDGWPIWSVGANAYIMDCAIFDTNSNFTSGAGTAVLYSVSENLRELAFSDSSPLPNSPQLLLVTGTTYTIDTISGKLGVVGIDLTDRSADIPTVIVADNITATGTYASGPCGSQVCMRDQSEQNGVFSLRAFTGSSVGAIKGNTTGAGFEQGTLDSLVASDVLPSEDDMAWLQTLASLGVPGIDLAMSPAGFFVSNQPPTALSTPASSPPSSASPPDGVPAPSPNPPSRSGRSKGAKIGAAIGGSLAGVLLCAALVALAIWYKKYKGGASAEDPPSASPPAAIKRTSYSYAPAALDSAHEMLDGTMPDSHIVGIATTVDPNSTWALPNNTQVSCVPDASRWAKLPHSSGVSTQGSSTIGTRVQSTSVSSDSMDHFQRVQDAGSIAEGLQFIKRQVAELLRIPGSKAFGEYTLMPLDRLRLGGQGAVHFATRGDKSYAIKFFASEHAFLNERDLYNNASLGDVLPPLKCICSNSDGRWRDPQGRLIAPFLIMEKGEALNDWVKRQAPDLIMSMGVMCHVIKAVMDLHTVGLVHRDLKPSNTLWLSSRNGWTVMDYGSAGLAGNTAFLTFTLAYAAPESIQAFQNRKREVIVDYPVDVWSLGIMAFELFTSTRVFGPGVKKEEVLDVLLGSKLLPWEVDSPESAALLAKLGAMKEGVLGMLHRDPQQRAALKDVYAQWTGLFTNTVAAITGYPQ